MIPNERPTPLTDAEASRIGGHSQPSDRVSADFARTLERSLAERTEERDELVERFRKEIKQRQETQKANALIDAKILATRTAQRDTALAKLAERTEERDKLLEKQSWLIAHPTAIEAVHQVVEWTKCEQDRDTALAKLVKCGEALGRVKQEHEHFGYGFEDCRDKVIKTLEETK